MYNSNHLPALVSASDYHTFDIYIDFCNQLSISVEYEEYDIKNYIGPNGNYLAMFKHSSESQYYIDDIAEESSGIIVPSLVTANDYHRFDDYLDFCHEIGLKSMKYKEIDTKKYNINIKHGNHSYMAVFYMGKLNTQELSRAIYSY